MFRVPRGQRLLAAAVALVLVGAVWMAALAMSPRRPVVSPWQPDRERALAEATVHEPAPDTEGVGLDGRPLRLSDYRGKVVVVSFWTYW